VVSHENDFNTAASATPPMSLLALKSDQHRQLAYTDTLELTFCKRLLLKRTGRDTREPYRKRRDELRALFVRGSDQNPWEQPPAGPSLICSLQPVRV